MICRYLSRALGALLIAGAMLTGGGVQAEDEYSMIVLPLRTEEAIDRDMDNAVQAKAVAEDRMAEARDRMEGIRPELTTTKLEAKKLDAEKDLAENENSESQVAAVEAEKKANKEVQNLLNKLRDLRKAEFEAARAEAELANSNIQTLELEKELLYQRQELDSLKASSDNALDLSTAAQVVRDLEIRFLKLEKEQAESTQKLASREKSVVEQRMKLHEARAKLPNPSY